jgi:hypothetical protein
MMVASLQRTDEGVAEAREFTVKMMNGVMHELKRFLGISQKRGAPSLGIGKQAALLLDYEGRNIAQAVQQLCPQRNVAGHQHDRKCQDRVRLAAKHYYQSQSREFHKHLPIATRET